MKYIQTLTEKGKLKWNNSDAPEADGKFRDLSPKDLAAWLIKTRKGDMKRISGSLSQQVAFNQNDDKEYVKKMDKTRKEVYKQLDREDLLESVDMDDLKNAKEYLSNPHTILDITYDKTRRGDKFIRFDYENKYVPGKMLDSGPHFVNVRYDNNKDLKKISKELGMDLKESVLNEEDTWNDYPAAAKKNAQKAIDWKEKYGRDEVDAGTPVGWARAHQLAKGENLSTDTVKRMSAFNRHRKNSSIKPELKETPWKDRGYVAWLIWGGDEGVDWAIKKSKEIDAMKESKQMKHIKPLHEARAYKLKASEFGADTHSAAYNVKGEDTWRVHSTYAIDQVSGENNPEERDVVFFEAFPYSNEIIIKIGGINNLKRTNGATVGKNFGTTVEEWEKDPKGIAKEASDFLTDADHLKWINKKARSEGQKIKWALKDDYSSVIIDLVNKSLGLSESVVNEAEKYITDEFKVGDKIKTNFGEWEVIETDYKPGKSFIAPFIFKGKDMKRVNIPNPPKTNKNAVGYKVTDGDKYPIIGFLYQYKDITKLATVGVDESVVNEEKIKYVKGKTYQSSGHWTVMVDSNSSMCDIRVNSSAGWRLDPHDDREETWELLDGGRQRATIYFRRGSIDKFAQQMFDLNDRTTWGNKTLLTAKDYADIIRVWIDMKKANESIEEAKRSTVHKAAKKGSYPAVIVVVQDGKVIHQEPVSTPDIAPATFNVMQEKYPKALLHLEDNTGKRLFSESVAEGIYAKESKIVPGEYIKTQYGYFYKRVEGTVGGEDAYVEIKKGKEGKRKTSIHDTVDFEIVDKSIALGESVTEGMSKSAIKKAIKVIDQQIEDEEGGDGEPLDNETLQALEQERERLLGMNERKYIKSLNEGYWSSYDYGKWTKENGKPKYPKWVKTTLKEIVKGGFMEEIYDDEHNYMVLWLASLESKRRSELYAYDKKGIKEFGKVGYAMYQRFYNDLTGYNMFFMQGAMYALEVSKHIQDRIANGEPVEPAYYMMKEYFNGFGMKTDRSRVFNAAYEKLEKWMKDNQIETL